jgi:hypothetical protein
MAHHEFANGGDGAQLWSVAVIKIDKQSPLADNGRSSSLE